MLAHRHFVTRHLAQLSSRTRSRRFARLHRAAAVHHHATSAASAGATTGITTPLAHDLDLASWDDYVGPGPPRCLPQRRDARLRARLEAAELLGHGDAARLRRTGRRSTTALDRGRDARHGLAAIGHGADAVLFWQWRSALNGQEQYHGALVGPDGEPVPLYDEVAADRRASSARPRPRARRHHPRLAGRDPRDLRQPLGDRLPAPQRRTTSRSDVLLGLLPPAATTDALGGHRRAPTRRSTATNWSSRRASTSFRQDLGAASDGLRATGRPSRPRAALRHEGRYDRLNSRTAARAAGCGARRPGGAVLRPRQPGGGSRAGSARGTASIWAEALQPLTRQTRVMLRYAPNIPWLGRQPAALRARVTAAAGSPTSGRLFDPQLTRSLLAPGAVSRPASAHRGCASRGRGADAALWRRPGDHDPDQPRSSPRGPWRCRTPCRTCSTRHEGSRAHPRSAGRRGARASH